MKKFLPIISILNAVFLGVSIFAGLTIADKYFDGDRLIGFSICLGLATIAIIIIDAIFFAIGKYTHKKAKITSDSSLRNEGHYINKKQKITLIFLLLIIVVFIIVIILGLSDIIKLSKLCLFILAICSFVLCCVGLIVAYFNKK